MAANMLKGVLVVAFIISLAAIPLTLETPSQPAKTRIAVGEQCKLNGIVVMVFRVYTPASWNIHATVLRKDLGKILNVHESLLTECF